MRVCPSASGAVTLGRHLPIAYVSGGGVDFGLTMISSACPWAKTYVYGQEFARWNNDRLRPPRAGPAADPRRRRDLRPGDHPVDR